MGSGLSAVIGTAWGVLIYTAGALTFLAEPTLGDCGLFALTFALGFLAIRLAVGILDELD